MFDILVSFFKEFPAEGGKTLFENKKPIRDISKIAKRYALGDFFFDLLAIIPFNLFIEPKRVGIDTLNDYDFYYLLFLLKSFRIRYSLNLTDPQVLNKLIKSIYDTRRLS